MPLFRNLSKVFLLAMAPLCMAAAPFTVDSLGAEKLVVVTSADWNTDHGQMSTFTLGDNGWERASESVDVMLGRSGLGWGIGLHPQNSGEDPVKKEGDGRAPAGVFSLGAAFGYLPKLAVDYPYTPMNENHFCIDVPASPLYNTTVDASEVGKDAVEGSTEPMRRDIHLKGDQRYKKGIFVNHNPKNISGAGSCIFMHLWKEQGTATAGCTAMEESAMDQLLAWLEAPEKVLYVALPQDKYQQLQQEWNLPALQ
ncbi:L,D-transpeptidase family protein [Biformimicrobium ophioploci]|uniref:YkuD domain-containing protein n=1 Tax=Biformimicrobium ophioploci TaxID=3036711 RepID=A0ABQ6LZD7_9GAMM|nr:hypothetical protein [Microbulbifer sp. NKW57]GMG87424.1 hypothetical protein MNKW57_17450 [Microbulbifer sp. NKW57]